MDILTFSFPQSSNLFPIDDPFGCQLCSAIFRSKKIPIGRFPFPVDAVLRDEFFQVKPLVIAGAMGSTACKACRAVFGLVFTAKVRVLLMFL